MVRFIQRKIHLLLNILEEESVSLLVICRNKQNPGMYLVDDYLDSHHLVRPEEVPDWPTFELLVQRIRELHERDILGIKVEEHIPTMPTKYWGEYKDQEAISSLIEMLSILERHSVDEINLHPEQALVRLRVGMEKFDIPVPYSAFDSVAETIESMYRAGVFDVPVYVEEEEGKWRRIIKTC